MLVCYHSKNVRDDITMNIKILLNDLKQYNPKIISNKIIITNKKQDLSLIVTTYNGEKQDGEKVTFYRVSDNYEIANNTQEKNRKFLFNRTIQFCNQVKSTDHESWLVLPVDSEDSTQVFGICADTIDVHHVKELVERLWKFAE